MGTVELSLLIVVKGRWCIIARGIHIVDAFLNSFIASGPFREG